MEEQKEKYGIRVVCISDTHNQHQKLTIPDGDILIHGGDFTNFGRVEGTSISVISIISED